jgi:hypothetical protein
VSDVVSDVVTDVVSDVAIDEVRARLEARGLLATGPAIVVPREPRPEPDENATPLPSPWRPTVADGDAPHWAHAAEDEWDVEGGGVEVAVRCPGCRDVLASRMESTRLACGVCDRTWRWAVCGGCDALAVTMERQESWRCTGCNHVTRSWWRAPGAAREAGVVVARRKDKAMQDERARVRAGIRKRRWKLVALGVVAAVAAVGMVIGVRLTEPSSARGTTVACAHVDRLRSDIASGTLTPTQLDDQLEQLQAESQGADERVSEAVVDLRAAGRPGSSAFLVARTALVDACAVAVGS